MFVFAALLHFIEDVMRRFFKLIASPPSLSSRTVRAVGLSTAYVMATTPDSVAIKPSDILKSKFGYSFNEEGVLRNEEKNCGFEFNVYESRAENQKRYEEIGKIVEKYIFELLETEANLKRLYIPLEDDETQSRAFIFQSKDAFTCDKLAIIIHGAGVVRAGQWSRRLIINNSLESGSQLPYIKKAKELGYGVLVLNTNQCFDEERNLKLPDKINSPESHFLYVWKEVVMKKCKASQVAIVAHSYGGQVTVNGALKEEDMMKRTFAVAFTDSVHYVPERASEAFNEWMKNNVCNWVSSYDPLDTNLKYSEDSCKSVSAGTPVHEETSWKAFDSVWTFIGRKLEQRLAKVSGDITVTDKEGDNVKTSDNKEKEDECVDDEKNDNGKTSDNKAIDDVGSVDTTNNDDMGSKNNDNVNEPEVDDEPMSQDESNDNDAEMMSQPPNDDVSKPVKPPKSEL